MDPQTTAFMPPLAATGKIEKTHAQTFAEWDATFPPPQGRRQNNHQNATCHDEQQSKHPVKPQGRLRHMLAQHTPLAKTAIILTAITLTIAILTVILLFCAPIIIQGLAASSPTNRTAVLDSAFAIILLMLAPYALVKQQIALPMLVVGIIGLVRCRKNKEPERKPFVLAVTVYLALIAVDVLLAMLSVTLG